MRDLFVELLQVAVGTRDVLSRVPLAQEWESLFDEAKKQALVGVMACGIGHLPKEQKPQKKQWLPWVGQAVQIETANQQKTDACKAVCEVLDRDGFFACVLKGQANHRYYPTEMRNLRSCGDVDVWVSPKDKDCKHPEKTVLRYVRGHFNMNGLCWLHTSHLGDNNVTVEIHFRPSFMNEPCRNRRFQHFYKDIEACRCIAEVDGVSLPVMKVDDDVIYQMNHIYRHLIDEGVGFRQVVDYFFLLRAWNGQHDRTKECTMQIVSRLGMKRFAGALMYVLHEVLGMPEEMLLCPAAEKDGEFLLNEIHLSGNFGRGDPRMKDLEAKNYYTFRVKQAWRRFKRNFRFLTSYPSEVIWEPYTRFAHFVWKKLKLWRF